MSMTAPANAHEADRVWLSPTEAADAVGVNRQTIYRAIRTRRLTHHKLDAGDGRPRSGSPRGRVRIHRDDLQAWLDAGRVAAR